MMFKKYRSVFILFALISVVLFMRLKRVEVNVQTFNEKPETTEVESLQLEKTVNEVIVVKTENRKVYSVGLDQTFTDRKSVV